MVAAGFHVRRMCYSCNKIILGMIMLITIQTSEGLTLAQCPLRGWFRDYIRVPPLLRNPGVP